VSFKLVLTCGADETWESNVAEIPTARISSFFEDSFGVFGELKALNADGDLTNNVTILLRNPHYRSLDEVSGAYRDLVHNLEEEIPIQRVNYFDSYKLFDDDENSSSVEMRVYKKRGWGASPDNFQLFLESYLKTGRVSDDSLKWVRTSEKKDKEYYLEVLKRTVLTQPENLNIDKLGSSLWVLSYTSKGILEASKAPGPITKGIIYSEEYGLSIEFRKAMESEADTIYSDEKMFILTQLFANEIFKQAEEKEIIPSSEYIYFMKQKRQKRTGSDLVPLFLGDKIDSSGNGGQNGNVNRDVRHGPKEGQAEEVSEDNELNELVSNKLWYFLCFSLFCVLVLWIKLKK